MVMATSRSFTLIYAREVIAHLSGIDRKYHSLIRSKIEEQLLHELDVETENRKRLQIPNTIAATWEIRFGPNNQFRVFYEVDRDSRAVNILAIGVKTGNRLTIGREEIEL
jgi:mRNA-degrading endonuclease RelE of RelBE toxin-antitoxin system